MAHYDIVLRGGRIVDGAGNPWFWGDLGVANGRIARIGRLAASDGARVVDLDGLVVCPGFIDMHTHSDTTLLADGEAHSKIRQGVTLDIIGESNSVTRSLARSPRSTARTTAVEPASRSTGKTTLATAPGSSARASR